MLEHTYAGDSVIRKALPTEWSHSNAPQAVNGTCLRLCCTSNATFDVCGHRRRRAQHRNFDSFEWNDCSRASQRKGGLLIGAGTRVCGTNIYPGGRSNDGTLQLGNGGTSGSIIGDVLNNGTFAFNRSDALTYAGVISGGGAIRQVGTGLTKLTGISSAFTGATSVEAGTLSVNGLLGGTMTVLGGRLQGIGTVGTTALAAGGTIAPGNSIGTLTINGNYMGNGGTLDIETVLGGDASPSDRLVVTGNTSGSTNVKVINVGGGGAQTVEGIKIVDVGGTSGGTFTLLGDYLFQGEQAMVGGAYAYRLQKNGISTPADGDGICARPSSIPASPTFLIRSRSMRPACRSMNLCRRSAEFQRTRHAAAAGWQPLLDGAAQPEEAGESIGAANAVWGRIEAAHSEFSPARTTSAADYDATTWKLQAGVDGLLDESEAGLLIGGVTVHYGTVSSDVSSIFGTGSIDATGYGFGGTLTWYGNSGFYVDAQAAATWYDTDLASTTFGHDARRRQWRRRLRSQHRDRPEGSSARQLVADTAGSARLFVRRLR